MIDDEFVEQVAATIDARIAERIADARRRRGIQRADRARRAAARAAGLRQRHAAKLARLAADPMRQPDPMRVHSPDGGAA